MSQGNSLALSSEVKDFGENPYIQFSDFVGYGRFRRCLFKLRQRQLGRCTAATLTGGSMVD